MKGDGDGTVTLDSLIAVINEWTYAGKKDLISIHVEDTNHYSLVSTPEFSQAALDVSCY